MESYLTVTPSQMRSVNRTAVFEYIRMKKQASRAVISSELDISLPSVVRIVDDLLEKGYLRFSGQMEDSGGRKRPLVEMNGSGNFFIGVTLSASGIQVALLDLGGTILESEELPMHYGKPEESLAPVFEATGRLMESAGKLKGILRGISVSVPGVVNHRNGAISAAPTIRWNDVPVKEMLSKRYGLPVIVENDATLAILGEMWYGYGQECFNLFLFEIDMGLGAGLVIDGAIYRGAGDSAGEIGNLVFDRKFFSAGKEPYGPAELDIAGVGLLRKVKATDHGRKFKNRDDRAVLKMLFEAFDQNEKWAKPIIDSFINSLSMAVTAVHSILNPELIVLRGCVMDYAENAIKNVQKKTGSTIIKTSKINVHAEMFGGAVNLIYELLDYRCLRRMY